MAEALGAADGTRKGDLLSNLGDAGDGQSEGVSAGQVFGTGVPAVLLGQLGRNDPPDVVLRERVLDIGDRVAGPVGLADGRDGSRAGAVARVGEAGMVSRQIEDRERAAIKA
jgi:hypothetical protein